MFKHQEASEVDACVTVTASGNDRFQHLLESNPFALHDAIESDNRDLAAALLQCGADPNKVNKEGYTALHLSSFQNNKDILSELLQRGVNVKAKSKDGDTALHITATLNSKEIAFMLLNSGADFSLTNSKGNTPLHTAAWFGAKEIAVELIQRGADVVRENNNGNNALHLACMSNCKEIAVALLQCDTENTTNASVQVDVSENGKRINGPASLTAFVDKVNKSGDSPLHIAALSNSQEIVDELIKHGADINAVNKSGYTPLHVSCSCNSKSIAVDLLKHKADVNVLNKRGNTALHLACMSKSKDIILQLLQHEARVNVSNEFGDTPLHLAAVENDTEIATVLIKHGAHVMAVNDKGNTALHLATKQKNEQLVAELLKSGSNCLVLNDSDEHPIGLALKQKTASLYSVMRDYITLNPLLINRRGQTAFHIATKSLNKELLEQFMLSNSRKAGVPKELLVNCRDIDGNTPLHYWAREFFQGPPTCSPDDQLTKRIEYGQNLIDLGALVNARNSRDLTPLHVASSWEVVQTLIKNGARSDAVDLYNGDTPLITRIKSVLKSKSCHVYERFKTPTNEQRPASSFEEWQELAEKGMDPLTVNKEGESVLKILMKNNNFVLVNSLISFLEGTSAVVLEHIEKSEILHLICASGADELQVAFDKLLKMHLNVNAMNEAKETALHLVCRKLSDIRDSRTMIYHWTASRLLAYGADPRLKNKDGASCFDISENVPAVIELLKEPVDLSSIPPLLKWSEPKCPKYRHKVSQVVRNQKSHRIEHYHYHNQPIGSGSFGSVFAGVDERNGREVAVKRIEKQRMFHPEDQREIFNLVKLRDCNEIVKYIDHCEDSHFTFLILDLMEGTLDEYLDTTPRDCSINVTLCQDIVNGVCFLHQNNVMHRDIKPGNILYKSFPKVCLKLADFGLSTKTCISKSFQTASVMHSAAGTRCWMAPELLKTTEKANYSKASDTFASGLVIHFLLAGKFHPFTDPLKVDKSAIEVQNETERNIMEHHVFYHDSLCPEARDILERMLAADKNDRPTIEEVKSHPIFWERKKMVRFLQAVGNQREIQKPRHLVKTHSPVEVQLENTLEKEIAAMGWQDSILHVYADMTSSGGRRYNTMSAVDLVRFVRNAYAHVSEYNRSAYVQQLLLEEYIFFKKFPSLLIETYNAVVKHEWDKTRVEIQSVLKTE